MRKNNPPLGGLYVHVPFCLGKCRYCDFCSFAGLDGQTLDDYVSRLQEEIIRRAPTAKGKMFDTVYFGGGTPTLLAPAQVERILSALSKNYSLSDDVELTMECNPATADKQKLRQLRELGVNRLSIGAQSAQDGELQSLGRLHRFRDVCDTVDAARAVGFDNLSLDVMYGIPEQTPKSFADTLTRILALAPDHISAYSLIVEPGTPFFEQRDRLSLPDDDTVADMTDQALTRLRAAGFVRYEISNFARSGKASRHNLHYWELDDYLGFGISAHSLLSLPAQTDGTVALRLENRPDLAAYLRGEQVEKIEARLTVPAARDEYVMLCLRLAKGIDKARFAERFGQSFDTIYGASAAPFISMGLICDTTDTIRLTDAGFAVSNTVLSEILY